MGNWSRQTRIFSCFRSAVLCSFACQKVKHAHFLTLLWNGPKKRKPQCSANFETICWPVLSGEKRELRSGKLASGLPALSHFASSIIPVLRNLCKFMQLLLKRQLLLSCIETGDGDGKLKSANKNFFLFSVGCLMLLCLPKS